jgi:hypothetical protein
MPMARHLPPRPQAGSWSLCSEASHQLGWFCALGAICWVLNTGFPCRLTPPATQCCGTCV